MVPYRTQNKMNINRRSFLQMSCGLLFLVSIGDLFNLKSKPKQRPNIIWIIAEDTSCHFGYQGEKLVSTPNIDRLAADGVVFSNAYTTCPVCSPSRSAMITGMYQTTIGAHNHRSSRGAVKYYLPEKIKLVPELFKNAGYYTSNCDISFKNYGKTDYNFVFDNDRIYDGPDWSARKVGQPFFAQIQLRGGKLRHSAAMCAKIEKVLTKPVKPEDVILPPYYPDHPIIRQDWAQYLNAIQYTDIEVGIIMKRLEKEGLLDNTIVFFLTDHGISHARGKQFLYDEGTKIPFVVWAPARISSGSVRKDLIAHIDIAATSLYFAGIDVPDYMESRPLFGKNAKPRDYVVCARDRCDETVDRIRSVRKGDFKYIRNFYPLRPYLQPCAYKDNKEIVKTIRQLYKDGRLDAVQSLHLAETRPPEELYDLSRDPFEINNLADKKKYQNKLSKFRSILNEWIKHTGDKGQYPESMEMYDSDMKVYIDTERVNGHTEYANEIERNIKLMKKWQAASK